MRDLRIQIIDWLFREKPKSEGGGLYKYREIASELGYSVPYIANVLNSLPDDAILDRKRRKMRERVKAPTRSDYSVKLAHQTTIQVQNWMARRREDGSAYTLEEIGKAVGVTGERVRQIMAALGVKAGDVRRESMQQIIQQRKYAKGIRPRRFTFLVRKWLLSIGYGYCSMCHLPKQIEEMAKSGKRLGNRCKRCTADSVNAIYHRNPESRRRWARENPEKTREYTKRWQAKNLERVRDRRREYYRANRDKINERLRQRYREKREAAR